MAITPNSPSVEGPQCAAHVSHKSPSAAPGAARTLARVTLGAVLAWAASASAQTSVGQSTYGTAISPLDVTPQGEQQAVRRRERPIEFRVSALETITDNVDLQPSNLRRSDAITRITPAVRLSYDAARARLEGDIQLPILLYARTSRNDRVSPQVNLSGHLEAIEKLFYVDASAYLAQSYFSAFGPTSPAIENNPNNAYNAHTYRISPYLRSGNGDYVYELRDNNIWTNASNTPVSTDNFYTNELLGLVRRNPTPLGWSGEYRYNDLDFGNGQSQILELARASAIMKATRELEVSASAGYENDRLLFSHNEGAIYGVAARWRPNNRLRLDANWEHRFFGPAYHFRLEDRTRLTVWSFEATREITSYPQLLGELAAGDVSSLLDTLFTSRIPDEAERSQFIQQFIDDRGLPQTLSGPVNIYTRQVHLEERLVGTVGLIGARNTVFLRVYRSRTEPVPGNDLVDFTLDQSTNSTQVGGTVTWTHTFTPKVRFSSTIGQRYVESNDQPDVSTRELSMNARLSVSVAARTSVYGGVRYQRLRSDVFPGYDESALFAGISYVFY
jgi:uncharacterized protein (PEP-CTERM system associated)